MLPDDKLLSLQSPAMKLDVFLPSLLVSPDWFADSVPPRLPAIETLMAHGTSRISGEWPGILLSSFGLRDAQGIAALSALGDEIEVGDHGWMFAEPAHFQADRDTLNLLPCSQLGISASEATQLIHALNANFADRGLLFACGNPGNWYVRCSVDELPQTMSIFSARRGAIFEKLPQSRGKLSWKAIQNEAQMLFHSHAVNEARETAGKLTINGLWFWGEGALPTMPVGLKPGIGVVFGGSALVGGLAKRVDARFAPVAQLTVADTISSAEHNLLAIDALTIPFERGDTNAWREAALKLDAQFFALLLTALRAATLDEVSLTLPRERDSLVFTINTQSLRGVAGWWKNLTQKPHSFLESSLA